MRGFVARILITAFGLWLADMLLDGISFDGAGPLFIGALLLGLVNAVIRPIVVLLTLPFTLVTLGLFLFIVNGAMIMLVAWLMPTFHVTGLGSAILASIIVGITGWIANSFVGDGGGIQIYTSRGERR